VTALHGALARCRAGGARRRTAGLALVRPARRCARSVIARRTTPSRLPPPARIRRLCVHMLDVAGEADHSIRASPLFATTSPYGAAFHGNRLGRVGLPLPAIKVESVAIFHVTAA
jgi:hypothetical protein